MSILTWPAPTAPQRRQRLVDLAVDLDSDPADLDTAIRDRLLADTSAAGIELNALLRCAALRDIDHLSGHLADVAAAAHAVERHGLFDGHGECCDGECTCTDVPRFDRQRCDQCERQPHETLDNAVDQLLWLLRNVVSARGVDEYLAAS